MDGTRQEFLPSSGLSVNQHCCIAGSDLRQDVTNATHGRASADQIAHLQPAFQFLATRDRGPVPTRCLEQTRWHCLHLTFPF